MSNFNQNKIAIDKSDIQKIYKRQLELVKENQEQRKDIEFRDYRIRKLEKELRDLNAKLLELTICTQQKEIKLTYERVNIYG